MKINYNMLLEIFKDNNVRIGVEHRDFTIPDLFIYIMTKGRLSFSDDFTKHDKLVTMGNILYYFTGPISQLKIVNFIVKYNKVMRGIMKEQDYDVTYLVRPQTKGYILEVTKVFKDTNDVERGTEVDTIACSSIEEVGSNLIGLESNKDFSPIQTLDEEDNQ